MTNASIGDTDSWGTRRVQRSLVTSLSLGVNPRTVMEIVGHSALEMTMNVYGHVNLDTQRRALDELDKSLR